jgi:hypothetical protein
VGYITDVDEYKNKIDNTPASEPNDLKQDAIALAAVLLAKVFPRRVHLTWLIW